MRTAEFIERCLAAGMPVDMALAAAKAFEAELKIAIDELLEGRRARDRERKRAKNSADSAESVEFRGKDGTPEVPSPPPAFSPKPPQPPTPAPDGCSSHVCEPAREGAGPDPPKRRGTRLPDDWEPSELDRAFAKQHGLTDDETDRHGLEFRNFWTARSGAGATKLNWHRTWQNRVLEVADRKRRDAARLAPRPAQPGGRGRGDTSFADLLARRRGFVAD